MFCVCVFSSVLTAVLTVCVRFRTSYLCLVIIWIYLHTSGIRRSTCECDLIIFMIDIYKDHVQRNFFDCRFMKV